MKLLYIVGAPLKITYGCTLVLNMTGFVQNMTGLVLNIIGLVLNITGWPIQFIEVSLVYTKSGVVDKCSVNIIYSLIWVSDHEVLCSQETVSVLILDSEHFCVHRRWIQS